METITDIFFKNMTFFLPLQTSNRIKKIRISLIPSSVLLTVHQLRMTNACRHAWCQPRVAEGSAEEHGDVYQTTSQADLQDMMYFVMFLSAETSSASKWHFEFDNPHLVIFILFVPNFKQFASYKIFFHVVIASGTFLTNLQL